MGERFRIMRSRWALHVRALLPFLWFRIGCLVFGHYPMGHSHCMLCGTRVADERTPTDDH